MSSDDLEAKEESIREEMAREDIEARLAAEIARRGWTEAQLTEWMREQISPTQDTP